MAEVSPAELSPLPVPARSVSLPYQLTWADLAPCLPSYGGPGSAWTTYSKRGRHQGSDRNTIVTLHYRDTDGEPRQRTLFVKEIADRSSREAARYRYLSEHGVPVARLLATVDRAESEVIVLEFLPTIGIDPGDADELLAAAGKLNAVTDAPAEVFTARPGMDQASFDAVVLDALTRLQLSFPVVEPARWATSYRRGADAYRELPRTLTHGELAPQQVGRTPEGALVLFDLETAAERPRFADVANVLRTLALHTGRAEPELFATYLQHLRQAGGGALDPGKVWAELLTTRLVVMVEALPWLVTLEGDSRSAACVQTISDDLAHLSSVSRLPHCGRHPSTTRSAL